MGAGRLSLSVVEVFGHFNIWHIYIYIYSYTVLLSLSHVYKLHIHVRVLWTCPYVPCSVKPSLKYLAFKNSHHPSLLRREDKKEIPVYA